MTSALVTLPTGQALTAAVLLAVMFPTVVHTVIGGVWTVGEWATRAVRSGAGRGPMGVVVSPDFSRWLAAEVAREAGKEEEET